MILHRVRAWWNAAYQAEASAGETPGQASALAAALDENRRLDGLLSRERFLSTRLGTQCDKAALQVADLTAQLAAERAENSRLITALNASTPACECGGDAELTLRQKVVAAEQRAIRDRRNANLMADRLAAAEDRPTIGSLT